jgi:hypothetical protein
MAQYYRFDKDNASRRAGTVALKDAIGQMLKSYQLQTRFNETYLEAFLGENDGQSDCFPHQPALRQRPQTSH